MTKTYAFIDSNKVVKEYQVFEENVSNAFLDELNTVYQTIKYVLIENKRFGGVGSLWSEENQCLYPAPGEFKNMIWDFENEKYIPIIEKPEDPADISQGEWVWDPFEGSWIFTEPNGMPPLE